MQPAASATLDLLLAGGLWVAVVRARRTGSWLLAQTAFPVWAMFSTLLKSSLAMAMMSPSLRPGILAWLWTGGLVAVILAFLTPLPSRANRIVTWFLASLVAVLLWGDVLYYRVFGDFLTVSLWAEAHQAAAVASSLRHLLEPLDFAFLLSLVLVLPAALVPIPSLRPPKRKHRALLALLPASLFLLGNLVWLVRADPLATNFMRNRLYNWSHVHQNGLVAYHLYDLYHFAKPRLSLPEPLAEEVIWRRLQLSRDTIGPAHPHFGAGRGHNVLMIQLESFQSFVVGMEVDGQEVTPFLNRLREDCLYGEALDQTSHGSSSDAEFVLLNSLLPPSQGPLCFLFAQHDYRALPEILAEHGWHTIKTMPYDGAFWNARLLGQHFGYQRQHFTEDYQAPGRGERVGWGLSDSAIFEQLVPKLAKEKSPFFCYLTTLMMHHPFDELRPHQELLDLPRNLQGTMAGRYLQLARFRDQSLELLVARLKEAGLWDNTVLVLCGDHRSRMDESQVDLLGVPWAKPLRHRVPFFIHLPGGQVKGQLPPSLGQIDAAPTLLHLLGLDDANPVFLGRNALAGRHASVSPMGFVTDGLRLALWGGSDPADSRLYSLPEEKELPMATPGAERLYQQMDEELRVSDSLIFGDRIPEYAGKVGSAPKNCR